MCVGQLNCDSSTILAVFRSLRGRCEMFGLFSDEDPNLKRNRKAQKLRDKQWREHWEEQRSKNLKPKPERPLLIRPAGGKHASEGIRYRG